MCLCVCVFRRFEFVRFLCVLFYYAILVYVMVRLQRQSCTHIETMGRIRSLEECELQHQHFIRLQNTGVLRRRVPNFSTTFVG